MGKLVLRLRRGGRLLGSWTLGSQPLEFSLLDVDSGQEIGTFTATGVADGGVDEVPMHGVDRLAGDDFTVPLPEPTRTGPGPVESITTEQRRALVPNLAERPAVGGERRVPGDDLTMPVPEHTQGRFAAPATGSLAHGVTPRMRALPLDRVPSGAGVDMVAPFSEDTAGIPEVTLGEILHSMERETEELEGEGVTHDTLDSGYLARALGEESFGLDPETREIPPPTEEDEPPVRPAEVWVRKRSEWRSAGRLVTGQRVRMLGGWMRLRSDGRLVVFPGGRLTGSGTMVDGRHVEIAAGQDAISLPPGASVLLCFKEHGLYVRSEPLPESTDSIAYDSDSSLPP